VVEGLNEEGSLLTDLLADGYVGADQLRGCVIIIKERNRMERGAAHLHVGELDGHVKGIPHLELDVDVLTDDRHWPR